MVKPILAKPDIRWSWYSVMVAEAEQWVHSCLEGAIVSALIPQNQIHLQCIGGFQARVQADSVGPLLITTWGNRHCLVIFHSFTKWMEAIPVKRAVTLLAAMQSCGIVSLENSQGSYVNRK